MINLNIAEILFGPYHWRARVTFHDGRAIQIYRNKRVSNAYWYVENIIEATMKIKTRDLKLADVVQLSPAMAYSVATVSQIKDGMVTFFRPYTQTADFSYTGGVICYVGIEEFSTYQDSDYEYEVLSRKELK